eukprot:1833052-Pyramimonas_sp.AAC.2
MRDIQRRAEGKGCDLEEGRHTSRFLDSGSDYDSPSDSIKSVDRPRSTSPEHASKRAKVVQSDAAPPMESAPSNSRLLELKC